MASNPQQQTTPTKEIGTDVVVNSPSRDEKIRAIDIIEIQQIKNEIKMMERYVKDNLQDSTGLRTPTLIIDSF